MRNASWALPLLLAIHGCGGASAPTELPDLRGVWKGTSDSAWSWDTTYPNTPSISGSAPCNGTLTITRQQGSRFEGRYRIDCASGWTATGAVVEGNVGPETQVSFRLQAEEGADPGLLPHMLEWPCTVAQDPVVYTGSLIGATLRALRVQSLSCVQPGFGAQRVTVTASFRGVRQ